MPHVRRSWLIVGAGFCWLIAVAALLAAGLPDRAGFTGVVLPGGVRAAPELGALAPPFQAQTLTGAIDTGALLGTPILLNFWASWCEPCAVEMRELQLIHERLPDVRVIGVNLGEPAPVVSEWAQKHRLIFDLALDADGRIARLYALRGQPTTFVIASDGTIRHIVFGATTAERLSRILLPLLAEPAHPSAPLQIELQPQKQEG